MSQATESGLIRNMMNVPQQSQEFNSFELPFAQIMTPPPAPFHFSGEKPDEDHDDGNSVPFLLDEPIEEGFHEEKSNDLQNESQEAGPNGSPEKGACGSPLSKNESDRVGGQA